MDGWKPAGKLRVEKEIIGSSKKIQKILRMIDMIAGTRATVLITGENGTGKELVARRIHNFSRRRDKPFVTINCAAIPVGTLESELFGHEKGSFTSAYRWHPGKFEQANTGTLLLDEIAEILPHTQAKLLRVLQEREIDRVGGMKPIPFDVRIISTTNRDLLQEIREGRFREDLFYRLNVINIKVPPLRERCEDIPLLAEHFIEIYCNENGKPFKELNKAAVEKLQSGIWRGNIRELENCIERAVILSEADVISYEHLVLDENLHSHPSKVEEIFYNCTLAEAERYMIEGRLKRSGNNKTKAANDLGISARTIRNKLKIYRRR
ncbi:MAG: sigma-54-dependent Fis family transcriptional regulator [Candidatus Krumholzibacteria bacterium]|nr:sigma-54-dependent Fis family transcriptional regulator [Candidatus Krumholzibacteria bacterium]